MTRTINLFKQVDFSLSLHEQEAVTGSAPTPQLPLQDQIKRRGVALVRCAPDRQPLKTGTVLPNAVLPGCNDQRQLRGLTPFLLSHILKETQLSLALKWTVIRFGCHIKPYSIKGVFLANVFYLHILHI